MRVDSIKLKNYKCFKEFEAVFDSAHNLHVIIAPNMAGKSALLKGIRVGISYFMSGFSNWANGIAKEDHRVVGKNPNSDRALDSNIKIRLHFNNSDNNKTFEFKRFKNKILKEKTKTLDQKGKIKEYSKERYEQVAEGKEDSHMPLLLYVGAEYVNTGSPNHETMEIDGNLPQGYWYCMSDKSMQKFSLASLKHIQIQRNEVLSNEASRKIYGDFSIHAWENIQKAINVVLPDIIEVSWSETSNDMIVSFKNEEVRFFDMLSDGYRYLLLLTLELSVRASILGKNIETDAFRKLSGVVLIDEFGVHLHPSLQQDALLRITQVFPNIQFLITTHTPLLLNGLKKEQVHILSFNEYTKEHCITHPDNDIVGLGAEGILTQIFGLITTFDKLTISNTARYRELVRKKSEGQLNESEIDELINLNNSLSSISFDYSLMERDILVEEISNIIKKKYQDLFSKYEGEAIGGFDLSQDIEEALDQIINKYRKH